METWAEPGGSEIDTGAILTTGQAGSRQFTTVCQWSSSRRISRAGWIAVNNEPRDVADLLRPAEPGFFEAIPVSDKVNKVANTGRNCRMRLRRRSRAAVKAEGS